jgi:hypothetical protein
LEAPLGLANGPNERGLKSARIIHEMEGNAIISKSRPGLFALEILLNFSRAQADLHCIGLKDVK